MQGTKIHKVILPSKRLWKNMVNLPTKRVNHTVSFIHDKGTTRIEPKHSRIKAINHTGFIPCFIFK